MEIGKIYRDQKEIERQANAAHRVGLMQQHIAAVTPIE